MEDRDYMALALSLAERGVGWASPNPMVGAVIVKDGRIIGQGWHEKCGQPHAERNALAACTEPSQGATIYVTLEPCCHYGRQPPCTQAILESGIRRVVVGSGDPNPLVAGKGIALLRQAGIEVTEHVLEEECTKLNQVFFHYIRTRRPYVVMKYAMTMDGKIAAHTGDSKWVTGEEARNHVQQLRHRYTGIMVGVGTVLADDPLLTCRIPGGRSPVRILCDTRLRTPLTAQVVTTARQFPTLLATCCTDKGQHAPYEAAGCQVLVLPERGGHVDLSGLIAAQARRELARVLLEGGGTLNWAALEQGVVQKVLAYIAPKLAGGKEAKTPVEGDGISLMSQAIRLEHSSVTQIGTDFLIESEVVPDVHRDR